MVGLRRGCRHDFDGARCEEVGWRIRSERSWLGPETAAKVGQFVGELAGKGRGLGGALWLEATGRPKVVEALLCIR